MQEGKSDVQVMLEASGLFSKAGKVSGVKYPTLKLRTQLLSGHSPSIKPTIGTSIPPKARIFLPKAMLDKIVDDSAGPEIRAGGTITENSTGLGRQYRENWGKGSTARNTTPPVGSYDCSFALVEKRVRSPNLTLRKRTERRSEPPTSPDRLSSGTVLSPHIPSPISFTKQVPRPSITTQIQDVHEGRFQPFNDMPTTISKYRRVTSPDIAKGKRGAQRPASVTGPSFNTYRASYTLVQSDLGKFCPDFSKQIGHQPIQFPLHDLAYDRSFHLVEKRSTAPSFCPSQHRKTPQSVLPAFMCKGVSRLSLNILMDKGLEMNSFSVGKSCASSPVKTRHSSPSPKRFNRLATT